MGIGRRSGHEELSPLDAFLDDEGGFTSVAVAVALLLCLCLVFALAQGQRQMSKAADVQGVADACALAGVRAVRGYDLVVTIADACVLTMGLTGILVMGAGLILCCVPGAGSAGMEVVRGARKILDGRKSMAESAQRGLSKLEEALPALIASNSVLTVSANGSPSTTYGGVALPFPEESGTTWGLPDEVSTDIDGKAEELSEASDEAKEAKDELDRALEEGWRADCVDGPSCLRSRAASLAGLPDALNPAYPTPQGWNFGVPLLRSRAYYRARSTVEVPTSDSVDERANSAMRQVYYGYALDAMNRGYYRETPQGTQMDLPVLAHNTETTRTSSLHGMAVWPCTDEGGTVTIHAMADCPGAQGEVRGMTSLAALDSGLVAECGICRFDTTAMGRVASASTNISNGYEHYWRKVQEASLRYRQAEVKLSEAEEELSQGAHDLSALYKEALEKLAIPRPHLRPPGAWGCVGVVVRSEVAMAPGLQTPFAHGGDLSGAVAISAATLAADPATTDANVLSRFMDSVTHGSGTGVVGLVDGVVDLWGALLVGYGDLYGNVAQEAGRLFQGLDAIGLSSVSRWFSDTLGGAVAALGFEPVDLSVKKPVLCHSQDVLDKDGSPEAARIRGYLQGLPTHGSPQELLGALGRQVMTDVGETEVTVFEFTIPGTDISVPFKIRLGELWGAP